MPAGAPARCSGRISGHGVEPNRKTLEAFLGFALEQGIAHRPVTIEEIFPSSVQRILKV